jgi:hypothetical protein
MTVQLDQRPGLGRLYVKAVATARSRRGDRLPDIAVELADIPIDRDRLASYADVCGFRQSDVLPPTYPHVLAFPLAVTLMVDPSFPFPLPGLVHVANRITQQRLLRADDLRARQKIPPPLGEGRVGALYLPRSGGSPATSVAATPRSRATSTRSTSTRWRLDCSAFAAPSPTACG